MGKSALTGLLLMIACSGGDARPIAAVGGPCTTENAGVCASPTRLLSCHNQAWVAATDCKGPDGCRLVGESYECDLRGNSLGDLCPVTSEGKVRCDPDGGVNILRCRQGVLSLEFVCPEPSLCSFVEDAGLTCR